MRCDEPRVVGEPRRVVGIRETETCTSVSRVTLTLQTLPMSAVYRAVPLHAELVFPDPRADLAPGAGRLGIQDVQAVAELRLEIRVPVVRGHVRARGLGETDVVGDAVRLSM